MTVLSSKQRKLPIGAKTQTLVRIAKRATMKADWIEWEAPRGPGHVLTESDLTEIKRWRDRAKQATEELLQLVRDNPTDSYWTLPQRRAAGVA